MGPEHHWNNAKNQLALWKRAHPKIFINTLIQCSFGYHKDFKVEIFTQAGTYPDLYQWLAENQKGKVIKSLPYSSKLNRLQRLLISQSQLMRKDAGLNHFVRCWLLGFRLSQRNKLHYATLNTINIKIDQRWREE